MANVNVRETELFLWLQKEAADKCVHIITDRVRDEAFPMMPVLDLLRTRPPGEGWSMPPGNLKSSLDTRYGISINGDPYGEVTADRVNRFTRKKRHAIHPDAIEDALRAQAGRAVP